MQMYNFIFWTLYRFYKSINDEFPGFLAMMTMCWLFFFNLVSFLGFFLIKRPEYAVYTTKTLGVFVGVFIILLHSLYFLTEGRIDKIEQEFSHRPLKQRISGIAGVIAYIVFSIGVCLFYIVPQLDELF